MSKRDFFCSEVFICLSVIVLTSLLFFVPAAEVTASPKDKAIKTRFVFFDLTALDKEIGYMWARDANIARKEKDWDDAFRFVENLNEKKYAGYSDWRLPSKEKLGTLADLAKGQGYTEYMDKCFKKIGFKNVQSYDYCSSTTYTDLTTLAWFVYMLYGSMAYDFKADSSYVWPVRSGQ